MSRKRLLLFALVASKVAWTPNKRTQEVVYRVYRLPDDLRKRVKAKREKASVTLQSVIEASATESLPKIVNTLKTMGLGFDGKKRPARLPMITLITSFTF